MLSRKFRRIERFTRSFSTGPRGKGYNPVIMQTGRSTITRSWILPVGLFVALAARVELRGDIYITKNGDEIEAELIEDLEKAYRLRTRLGIVDVEKDDVAKVVRKASPWAKYDKRRKRCANTAQAHYELAQWCRERQLDTEYRDELERTIQLDANHEAARSELGYVRNKAGKWVRPKSSKTPSREELAARRQQDEEERLVRKLVSNWFVKVKALHKGRLGARGASTTPEQFAEGREQILAIRDPLAIPAISGVLSTGNVDARRLMVESLSNFTEDEATMNLLVAALLDPSEDVRRRAAAALSPRRDERVVQRLADALYSNEEPIIRHAAVALGVIKATPVVEDLINVLSKETVQKVVVSTPVFLDGVRSEFGGIHRYSNGRRLLRYQPTTISCLGPGTMVGSISSVETQTVMVHRTEVQEALIAITGQNFGFDVDQWHAWWVGQQKP